ncbi:hypothetical protein SUGI_0578520 [Cryptomeria japonica]|uniref:GDSL esterase/lipase At2g23540-like n=1 Tax=Cryptomeria japonica TaxID=3369 RepID=UPI0024147AC6|nr:GDSL esterase/lipase At2g23540-like [Cryptomeria japonica]GLJ29336.1 hypothetical protein SUGI_0578520 [Cryptomeria japonica]
MRPVMRIIWSLGVIITMGVAESNEIPFFIFGDSLADAGNNNYIASLSKADFPPYGIDFTLSGGRPTGRFTNGKTIPDIIGLSIGKTMLPQPYLAPTTKGALILPGVNYASGASGILNVTGSLFAARIVLQQQVEYFETTRMELVDMLTEAGAIKFLEKSVFTVTTGSNDYLINYLLPVSPMRARYTPDEFQEELISQLGVLLMRLFSLGARKFAIAGIGPLGCTPFELSLNKSTNGICISQSNNLVVNYNSRLKQLITQLNSSLPDSHFVYLNTYDVVMDLLQNYQKYGFENPNTACCGAGGQFRGIVSCLPNIGFCNSDRSRYIFWDAYHPTEATNTLVAKKFLDGTPKESFPINLRQLFSI